MVVGRRAAVFSTALCLFSLLSVADSGVSQDTAKEDVPLLSELVGKYEYAGNRDKDQAAIAAQIEGASWLSNSRRPWMNTYIRSLLKISKRSIRHVSPN